MLAAVLVIDRMGGEVLSDGRWKRRSSVVVALFDLDGFKKTAMVLADERMYRDKAERKKSLSSLQSITSELLRRTEQARQNVRAWLT